jgi:RNA polymerase sigma factor (sigma-70 family)
VQIKTHPTKEQYEEMLVAYHEATDESYRKFILDKILQGMYKYAVQISTHYCRSRSMALAEDGVQACLIGVIRAVNKFKFGKGASFSTYASMWMKAELFKMFEKNTGAILVHTRMRMQAAKRLNEGTSKPDDFSVFPYQFSWDELNTSDADTASGEGLLFSGRAYTPATTEHDLIHNDLYSKARSIMDEVLNEKEKSILLALSENETLQSIGDKLGVTRERVRQLSERALRKVREKAELLGMS